MDQDATWYEGRPWPAVHTFVHYGYMWQINFEKQITVFSERIACTVYYYLLLLLLFWAHQHKATGLKIKLSKIKMVATASHSVTIVLWKETTYPL